MPDRATTAQRNLLEVLLKRRGLLGRSSLSNHTGPAWRPIFRACGMPEPADPFSWPSVASWLDGLDTVQASSAIDYLQGEA